jgi:hypothetical protein
MGLIVADGRVDDIFDIPPIKKETTNDTSLVLKNTITCQV